MGDIVTDVTKVWDRLFDHKGFLCGEISFILHGFEKKRNDKEIDNLFKSIEVITDIKDTELDRFHQTADQIDKINANLNLASEICDKFNDLEEKYKQDTTLEDERGERKIVWDKFMDDITAKYLEINSNYENKVEEFVKFYEDTESKILV